MDKKLIRKVRALLWDKRGKYGPENVDFMYKFTEEFNNKGDPQDESYDSIINETLYLVTPDENILLFNHMYEGLIGLDMGMSSEFFDFHKEIIKLSKYFKGTSYFRREYEEDEYGYLGFFDEIIVEK